LPESRSSSTRSRRSRAPATATSRSTHRTSRKRSSTRWATGSHSACVSPGRSSPSRSAAGGIATARGLLADGPVLVVSGDVWSEYDYTKLEPMRTRIGREQRRAAHLVMVPNPPWHPGGDFALESDAGRDGGVCRVGLRRTGPLTDGCANLTYGNIGLYDSALFDDLPRGVKLKLLPLLVDWIGRGHVTGEYHAGRWANVGTPGDLAGLNAALATRA